MTRENSAWGLHRDARAPLLGRDAELQALDEALEAVETKKETRIVSLIGPAGIGKSRLVQDFVLKHRSGDSLTPRVYRGTPRDTVTAFGLFSRLLRARFGLVETMDADASKAQVRAQVSKVLDDRKVGDVVYFLGQFLGLRGDESPLTRAVSDDLQQADTIRRAVFKSFLESDAAHSPLCLLFDDLHTAHDDSLSLLRYLLEYLEAPILVINAARPELLQRHEDWARVGERRHTVIELGVLDDETAVKMMEAMLAPCRGGPPAQLVDSATAFANGNPLLLEQMVRIYHDKGVLEEENALAEEPSWRVDLEKLSTVELPLTIEDAVAARIAALDPAERVLLEQAAAMGSVFWSGAFISLGRAGKEPPDLWSDGDEDEKAVAGTLGDLVDRDYVLKLPDSTFPGSDEYIFKHNREREAIARRTTASALKRFHRGIADWLDHQEAVRTSDEYVAMLAEHREKGGDPLRAGLAYLEAGDVARRRYANAKASEYYQRGLDLLGDSSAGRRIDALHDFGDVLQILGRIDEALAAFREMLKLAYRLNLKSKGGAAHNRIGRLYREIGSLDDAGRHLSTAMQLFQATGDERGVASSIDDLGKLHWLKGEYDQALASFRDALARRRRLADRRSIALSLNNMGLVLQDSGEFKGALEAFDQALAIRRDIGDLVGVATTLNALGAIAQDQRDYERALSYFQEAHEVANQIGDRNRLALVLTNVGETHYHAGDPAKAIIALKRAEELCDELGDKLGLAEALRGLGKAHMLQGDLAKARDCIGRAVDLFAIVRSKVHLGVALRTLGEITAAGGWGAAHTKSAREYFARSGAIFEQTGNDVELARTLKVFSRFLSAEAKGANDTELIQEAAAMETKADEIFTRLRLAAPVDGASQGRFGRPQMPSRTPDLK